MLEEKRFDWLEMLPFTEAKAHPQNPEARLCEEAAGRRWIQACGAAERTRWAEIAGVWAGPRQARFSGPGGGARAGPALDAGDEWPDQAPPPARPGRFIL